jgi:3'(2'),5'-bisphosphate nucleotidase
MIDTIEVLTSISRKAGSEILNIYHNETLSREIESKSDNSPLTLADKASNRVIVNSLQNSFPDIPILSEEEKHVEYGERSKWKRFWLVDPLDGTKEFIKRNGEFTVNIALIDKGYPVLGIIYAPVLDTLYLGIISEKIAYKIDEAGVKTDLKVNNKSHRRTAVGSRSHSSGKRQIYWEPTMWWIPSLWAAHSNFAWWLKAKLIFTTATVQLWSGIPVPARLLLKLQEEQLPTCKPGRDLTITKKIC